MVTETLMQSNSAMLPVLTSTRDEERDKAAKLASDICQRAQGGFLWIRLVLDELLDEFTDGATME